MFQLFYLLGIAFLIVPTVRLPVIGFSPSDLCIFASFGWLMLETFWPRRQKRAEIPIHVLWIPALLILVGGTIASIGAISPVLSVVQTLKVWFVLAPWVSMGIVMVRRGYLMHILYVFVLTGAVSGLVAAIDQVTTMRLGAMISGVDTNYWTRMTGTFGHPSTLGYFTCAACPIAFGLFLNEWQTKRRPLFLLGLGVASGLLFVAMFSSGSVTAWLGTLVAFGALGIVWLLRARSWVRWSAVLLVPVLLIAILGILSFDLVPQNVSTVVELNLERASETTGPGRVRLLEVALETIDRDPLIGVGMDQTGTAGSDRAVAETYVAIHNTIISGWLNGGLLTFVGLVTAYLIAGVTALRGLYYGAGSKNWIVLGLSAATLAWMVFDQTQPQLSQRFTWMTVSLLFGLGFGIQLVPARQESSRGNAAPLTSALGFPIRSGKAGAGK